MADCRVLPQAGAGLKSRALPNSSMQSTAHQGLCSGAYRSQGGRLQGASKHLSKRSRTETAGVRKRLPLTLSLAVVLKTPHSLVAMLCAAV